MEAKLTIGIEEYVKRLCEIRISVNTLLDDLGVTYDETPQELERILNIAMNGDFADVKNGKIRTGKIIEIKNFRNFTKKCEYL